MSFTSERAPVAIDSHAAAETSLSALSAPADSADAKRRRATRRRPLWARALRGVLMLLLLVGGVVAAGLVFRAVGMSRLEKVQQRIASEGGDATFWDYATSFDVDPEAQEAFWEWQSAIPEDRLPAGTLEDAVGAWVLSPPGTAFPAAVRDELTRLAAYIEQGRALVRNERVVMTAGGFARLDLDADPSYEEASDLRMVSLLVMNRFALWLGAAAVQADDATPWLDDLDALERRLSVGGFVVPAGAAITIQSVYRWVALRGNVGADRLESWATDTLPYVRLAAEAARFDRCVFTVTAVRRRDSFLRPLDSSEWESGLFGRRSRPRWGHRLKDVGKAAWELVALPHDIARETEVLWQLEKRLRGDQSIDLGALDASNRGYLTTYGAYAEGEVDHARRMSFDELARCRADRLAALVIYDVVHRRRPIPSDRDAFRARWPRAFRDLGPDDPAMDYRRLSPSRFRIAREMCYELDRPLDEREFGTYPTRIRSFTENGGEFVLPRWMVERGGESPRPPTLLEEPLPR